MKSIISFLMPGMVAAALGGPCHAEDTPRPIQGVGGGQAKAQQPGASTVEQDRAENKRIDVAIEEAKTPHQGELAALDTQLQQHDAATQKVLEALTDRLRQGSLKEAEPSEANKQVRDLTRMLLGNRTAFYDQPKYAENMMLTAVQRSENLTTCREIVAALRKAGQERAPVLKQIAAIQAEVKIEVDRLEAQRPSVRLSVMDAAAMARLQALEAEAATAEGQAQPSDRGLATVETKSDLAHLLDAVEQGATVERARCAKLLSERVAPLVARCRNEVDNVHGLPRAEPLAGVLLSRAESMSSLLQLRSETDIGPVVAHHRALLALLPTTCSPRDVATASAAIDANQTRTPAMWVDRGLGTAWAGLIAGLIQEAAHDASLSRMTLPQIVTAVSDIWRLDASPAQAGRYQPLFRALTQVPSVKQASVEEGLAAVATLAAMPPAQQQRLEELRCAIEDGVGEKQRVNAGSGSLGSVNAWTETRPLGLSADARRHHIDLLNLLAVNADGPALARMRKMMNAEHQQHPAWWPDDQRLLDIYRRIQTQQFRTFQSKMKTSPDAVKAALLSFNRGQIVDWATIDRDDARTMAALAGGEALSVDAKPYSSGFWERAAAELATDKGTAAAPKTTIPNNSQHAAPPATPLPATPVDDPLFK